VILAMVIAAGGCRQGADPAPVTAPAVGPQPGVANKGTDARGGVTYINDCGGKPVQRPRTFVTACGDGNEGVSQLRWQGWGTARAVGSGVLLSNTCTPSCARGAWEALSATIVLDRLRSGEASAYYLRMVVTVEGDDAGDARSDVYRLAGPDDPGAPSLVQ